MDLKEAIDFIKSRTKQQFINTHHSAKRMEQRNINYDELKDKVLNGELVSITKQADKVYKLLISDTKYSDLCVIVKIYQFKIAVITAFKSDIKRREKNEKSK